MEYVAGRPPARAASDDALDAVVKAGLAAGLLGGVLMLAAAVLHARALGEPPGMPLRWVAATFLGDLAFGAGPWVLVWGALLHAVVSAGWGVVFALFIPRCFGYAPALFIAIPYAIAVLLVMTFLVTPVVDPELRRHVTDASPEWFLLHVLYAFALAAAPALRARWDRDAAAGGPARVTIFRRAY